MTVDGDADSIRVSTRLVYYGKDRHQHELTPGDLAALQKNQGAYRRIPEGWIYIDPSHVEKYRQAHRELRSRLGGLDRIEGSRIPETLQKLLGQKGFQIIVGGPSLRGRQERPSHLDEPAEVEFQIEVVENHGRSILEIVPAYNHDGVQLAHADYLKEAQAKREGWIRRRDTWISVDKEKCKQIDAAIKRLKLQPGTQGLCVHGQSIREDRRDLLAVGPHRPFVLLR